ncbi:flagellar hook-basal body complex protein FliE [Cellulomonas oligotrophica]|uniref:Flagellar hook-basal body complex protein FliE n=1 Tax=Cellulomonas oligotrophica TaxID=931536 RepID=A0A7Y9JYT6_9CELL|nr:flagellar hook-basal body complex protein FliE [Cellulomonas oligotrophica]NYD87246.1 flagellar hook-basal body complex protein FliE [Cellulomonas oligotrophica]
MAIAPVAGVTGVQPAAVLGQVEPAAAAGSASGVDFASVLGSVDQLQQMQSTSQQLAVQAVTGDLDDVHDYTVASAQSSLALELTATVRNKAVEAFTEIMRMQV